MSKYKSFVLMQVVMAKACLEKTALTCSGASALHLPQSLRRALVPLGSVVVCWRFGSYLRDVQVGAAKIEDEIEKLSHEIEALVMVNETRSR